MTIASNAREISPLSVSLSAMKWGRGPGRGGARSSWEQVFHKANRKQFNRGFSLVEVIVAVAIMSIALVGLAHGITTALSSSKESELQTTAAMYAAGLIENLVAQGGLTDGQMEGDCGDEMPLYRWTVSVSAAGIDGLHQVEASIQNTHSGQEIYALRTLLFEPPPDTDSKKDDAKSKKKSRSAS